MGSDSSVKHGGVADYKTVRSSQTTRRVLGHDPESFDGRAIRLQRTEKALDYGVVVTVCFATMLERSMDLELALIGAAGILDTLVAVMEQPRQRTPMRDRHIKRIEYQLTVGPLAHRPADNPPRVQIEQDGQIQPPPTGSDKGDIAGPHPVGGGRVKLPVQLVGRGQSVVARLIGRSKASHPSGFNPVSPPQPPHPVAATHDPLGPQRSPGFDRTIGLPVFRVNSANLKQQGPVLPLPSTLQPGAPSL